MGEGCVPAVLNAGPRSLMATNAINGCRKKGWRDTVVDCYNMCRYCDRLPEFGLRGLLRDWAMLDSSGEDFISE
ncbi:hypothetical protein L195_g015993 [Trifolium pratense]|uniref:Uncharacterized protein n=1 Tax=Trifolium pratense TaxID=57577 RepID=A0A2K3MPV8_TRIPR|nr:hypothetical protein L195_g015993 [Trifolium pratense]